MSSPGHRLKVARLAAGFSTAKEAAQSLGVPIATYTQHELATRHLPARRAAQYAEHFRTTPEFLLYGRTEAVSDRIETFDAAGKLTANQAAIPPAPSAITRAQQAVDGDGIAEFDFVALYDEPQVGAFPTAVTGRLCVVSVKYEGREERRIRIVQEGSSPHHFHLLRITGGFPETDVRIDWAAPVTALVPLLAAPVKPIFA